MSFLNGLFSLLSVVFFICLIIAVIKPDIFKMKTRLKAFLIFFAAMILCSVGVSFTMSDEQKAQIEQEKKLEQQERKDQEKISNEQLVQEGTSTINDDKTPETKDIVEEERVIEQTNTLTRPQINATRSAEQYLNVSGFSRNGLIDQLSSSYGDGYDRSDATIAVDSLNIDWNEQAVRSANQYLEMSGFSCNGLIDQLSSSAGDQYTKAQASYGAKQAGACS